MKKFLFKAIALSKLVTMESMSNFLKAIANIFIFTTACLNERQIRFFQINGKQYSLGNS
ncbi:MAG: hypothetical protein ACFCAD_05485 [Pleurocapsa sp.]